MKKLLIRNVWHQGNIVDVLIEGNRFTQIASQIKAEGAEIIEGKNQAILPPFYNTHAHMAMTLFRGYADDLPLFPWLNDYIWPKEALLTPEHVYAGSRLAILEMIKSGGVFFSDMYWFQEETCKGVMEMGVRAALGLVCLERCDPKIQARNDEENERLMANRLQWKERIQFTYAPHAIYTVSQGTLEKIKADADANEMMIHMHLSETEQEVADCLKEHGCTPVEYVNQIGLLSPRLLAAHCVKLTSNDIRLLADTQTIVAHMPCSNAKLCSGFMPLADLTRAGAKLTIGTDGAASNNNLSMFDEMKFAALNAKAYANDPTVAPAQQIFDMATRIGAEAFGIDAGVIEVGKLADCILVNLNDTRLVPNYHLISNMVYSADSSCVQTVICNGKVIMKDRYVEGEEDIIAHARKMQF